MNKHIQRGLLAVGVLAATASHAAPPDFTLMTGAVDMSTVVAAIMAIGVILVGVSVARKGVSIILRMLGR
ncbi:MAG: hypothetical protein ACK4S6_16330 [Roseateles asaccharophilus]|uniref:hypothetical protein n=1 Tax=Roseateles asaccharophilus TaxID=582607 RepID=UPI00391C04FC